MKKTGVILILTGLVLVIIGLVINKSMDQRIPDYKPEVVEQGQKIQGNEKNSDFINFVRNSLSRRYFSVSKMEPDNDRAYADLMVEYEIRGATGQFFLKAKWYLRYYNNEIEVATNQDVLNYQTYLKNFDEPMFKIIGIGGRPSKPKQVYIIPVAVINNTSLTINEISKYIKDDQSVNFFFDTAEKSLK